MHDLLPVDEVAGLFDLVQQVSDVVVPAVEHVVREPLTLLEHNTPSIRLIFADNRLFTTISEISFSAKSTDTPTN